MTLKQLEAFYWAASCQNFAVAAGRLNISISSLSKRISEFESDLNGQLFSRASRSVVLTPLGEQLLPYAQVVLKSADQFLLNATNSLSLSGRCRFGVGEVSAKTWLPAMLRAVKEDHPELWVETTISFGQQLEQKLVDGELDFAIISGRSTRSMLASHVVGSVSFHWVGSGNVGSLNPSDLTTQTLITLPQGAGTVRLLDEWLTLHRVSLGRHLECPSVGAVVHLISEGVGVGFIPSTWAEALIARNVLKSLGGFPPLEPLPYSFHWRRDDTRPMIEKMRNLTASCIDFTSLPIVL